MHSSGVALSLIDFTTQWSRPVPFQKFPEIFQNIENLAFVPWNCPIFNSVTTESTIHLLRLRSSTPYAWQWWWHTTDSPLVLNVGPKFSCATLEIFIVHTTDFTFLLKIWNLSLHVPEIFSTLDCFFLCVLAASVHGQNNDSRRIFCARWFLNLVCLNFSFSFSFSLFSPNILFFSLRTVE